MSKEYQSPTHVIGIDPSLGKLGMSIYSLHQQQTETFWYITQPLGGPDWMSRAVRMAQGTVDLVDRHWNTEVDGENRVVAAVETPSNWFTDKGMDSKNAGDIQKLYWFVGHLTSCLIASAAWLDLAEIWTVVPNAWKGQTPKSIMVTRAVTHLRESSIEFDEKDLPHDAAEAVLLAKITGNKLCSNLEEGKGWERIWSSISGVDSIKARQWPIKID